MKEIEKNKKYKELEENGMIDAIKYIFKNQNSISKKYFFLIADYIDSLSKIENFFYIDATVIAEKLPDLLNAVEEVNIYYSSIYSSKKILINKNLDEKFLKIIFFKELNEILYKTENASNFLTSGSKHYLAEILLEISNNRNSKNKKNKIKGLNNHYIESPFINEQLNCNVINMLSIITKLSVPEIINFFLNNREEEFENFFNITQKTKFKELNELFEKIFNISYYIELNNIDFTNPVLIKTIDQKKFYASYTLYEQWIIEIQKKLMLSFLLIEDNTYIMNHIESFASLLTTEELKKILYEIAGKKISKSLS